MIVGTVTELTVINVLERGIPNEERIVLRANDMVNMGQFGIMLGVSVSDETALPIHDNLYWFGDGYVLKGDWVFLYTGPGEPRTSELPGAKDKLYTIHWGRKTTVLGEVNVVPILFRVDAVQIPTALKSLASEIT